MQVSPVRDRGSDAMNLSARPSVPDQSRVPDRVRYEIARSRHRLRFRRAANPKRITFFTRETNPTIGEGRKEIDIGNAADSSKYRLEMVFIGQGGRRKHRCSFHPSAGMKK